MILTKGKRYRGQIALGFIEAMASNATVARKLLDAGFIDVTVEGDGRRRAAIGTWNGPTMDAQLPSQVVSVVPL